MHFLKQFFKTSWAYVASAVSYIRKYNKTSSFKWIMFIGEDYFTKHTNITNKLKWRLFTKVIREPSDQAYVHIDKV